MRGRAGRVNGLLAAGLTIMKGLPSGYNRDFHEDKEILVESLSLVNRAVEVVPPLINSTTINIERMKEVSYGNFANATELANYLVGKHNIPFREAHDIVGALVGKLYRAGQNFQNRDICYEFLKESGINAPKADVERVLDPKQVMLMYESRGGTGKKAVEKVIKDSREELAKMRAEIEKDKKRLETAWNATRSIAKEAVSVKNQDDLKKLVAKYRPK